MDRWSPELRRALTRVRPEFFGWTPEQKLRYRAALPADDYAAIVAFWLRRWPAPTRPLLTW
jgi:hypothetical protein